MELDIPASAMAKDDGMGEGVSEETDFLNPNTLLNRIGATQGMVVADLGAGTGYLSLPLALHVGDEGKVYAVDIMKDSLGSIQDKALDQGSQNLQTVWADLEMVGSTKISEDSCDLSLMVNVYFQLEKPAEAIKEAKRIAKNDGKIVIVDWQLEEVAIGPPQENRVAKEEVIRVAQDEGLKLKEDFDVDKYHYGLVFTK